jgi:hypothetical protein
MQAKVAPRLIRSCSSSCKWYLGYDLGEPLPDHSSLTRIRERYGVKVFQRFIEKIVEQCQETGLVWGKELYIDATKVEANASIASVKPRFAVEAHLAHLFETEPEEVREESGKPPSQEGSSKPVEQEETHVPMQLPTSLTQHNAQRHNWIEQLGAQDRSVTGRTYQLVADLRVSTTDLDASMMLTKGGSHLGYQTHYVVDGGKARIILLVVSWWVTRPSLGLLPRSFVLTGPPRLLVPAYIGISGANRLANFWIWAAPWLKARALPTRSFSPVYPVVRPSTLPGDI